MITFQMNAKLIKPVAVKNTAKGLKIATLVLADMDGKKVEGEKYRQSAVIEATTFGYTAEFAEKYLADKDLVCVAGEITQDSYTDKEGHPVKRLKFRIDKLSKIWMPTQSASDNSNNSHTINVKAKTPEFLDYELEESQVPF